MTNDGKRWLWGVTGLAAFFRFPALFANTFHADEALFASFARQIAVWRDPLLTMQPVDKPPLLFYLQALFYPLFGPVAWAARLPDFIASLLLVPLVGMLAWRLFRDEKTAVATALLIALLPLPIQFSATAFTDPLLTTLLVASLLVASGRWQVASGKFHLSPATSGLFFGLAVITKYQAWLFLPLLAGLGWLRGWRWRQWRRWAVGLLLPLGSLAAWEWARTGRLQLWSTQINNFGGLRLSWSWELWPRAQAWAALWGEAMGGIWLVGLMAVVLVLGSRGLGGPSTITNQRRGVSQVPALYFLLFILGYVLLHWILAIPIWDRYLLPLLPIIALVVGRWLTFRFHPSAFILLLLFLPGAWGARHGRFPIGGYPQADQGAAIVAEALDDAPYGTVLYDHWYSWQWRYHLFDSRVYVSWFPSPAALAEELTAFGADGNPHYLALPDTAVGQQRDVALPVKRAVTGAGFYLHPVPLSAPASIKLYEIVEIGD